MNEKKAELAFSTPCFCAGADQKLAEVRVPSIRGQLRWWFRVLGGTDTAEHRVFGGIGYPGDDRKPEASRIVLRISDVEPASRENIRLPEGPQDSLYYLLYFAKVSGNDKNVFRYDPKAWLPPGSRFTLHGLIRRPLEPQDEALFWHSWEAFLLFGSLGLRHTRGFGAMTTLPPPTYKEFLETSRRCCPGIKKWVVGNSAAPGEVLCKDWKQAMILLEAALGGLRQSKYSAGLSGNIPTPLGRAQPERQASAVHLRPVQISVNGQKGFLPLLFYTPSILAPASQQPNCAQSLDNFTFKTPYAQKKRGSQDQDDRRDSRFLKPLA